MRQDESLGRPSSAPLKSVQSAARPVPSSAPRRGAAAGVMTQANVPRRRLTLLGEEIDGACNPRFHHKGPAVLPATERCRNLPGATYPPSPPSPPPLSPWFTLRLTPQQPMVWCKMSRSSGKDWPGQGGGCGECVQLYYEWELPVHASDKIVH